MPSVGTSTASTASTGSAGVRLSLHRPFSPQVQAISRQLSDPQPLKILRSRPAALISACVALNLKYRRPRKPCSQSMQLLLRAVFDRPPSLVAVRYLNLKKGRSWRRQLPKFDKMHRLTLMTASNLSFAEYR